MNGTFGTRHSKLSSRIDRLATFGFWLLSMLLMLVIVWLLFTILKNGIFKINLDFLTKLPDEMEAGGGIGPVLFNSLYVLVLSLIFSLPIGIGAGIYMAEYAPANKFTEGLRICVEGLASVPSIIFGLLGLAIFVEFFHIGLTILGGSISLALLNLPVLTRVTEEAVRAVPREIREASFALGASKFQCIRTAVLPAALHGIVTGVCLVSGRAFGESAVIILTAGLSTSGELLNFNLFDPGATLAVHLWYVQSEAIVPDAREIADKSAAVLVLFVLIINLLFRFPLWLKERKLKK
ncbi:phosphate ABC transporter permease PstA [Paenibacillus eucommiae]|uniref:Phosphate transport system permease protein PstA n=1 Tax=Paenibacillus eucommiae TaxID=1355755 RepID=A0ABS4J506_9BACL|nr:phosphate ABC transporter permease PstA [Paenibacillus eucommiae]MBP1994181.1 phosphate transport system permease protein [Paenibacillus eucommiae]